MSVIQLSDRRPTAAAPPAPKRYVVAICEGLIVMAERIDGRLVPMLHFEPEEARRAACDLVRAADHVEPPRGSAA